MKRLLRRRLPTTYVTNASDRVDASPVYEARVMIDGLASSFSAANPDLAAGFEEPGLCPVIN
jgi:hypothetical protein